MGIGDEQMLVRHGVMSNYRAGETIFSQGDPCGCLFYLYSGRVDIYTLGINGDEKTHFIQEKGTFFGEAAFFAQNVHIATGVAREESCVIRLDEEALRRLFADDPDLPFSLLRALSGKMHQLASQVDDLSYLAINQRLARLLLKLAEDQGKPEEGGIVLPVNITDEELGKLIGARREAVSRVLSALKDLGIAEKVKRKIYVKDTLALRDYISRDRF